MNCANRPVVIAIREARGGISWVNVYDCHGYRRQI